MAAVTIADVRTRWAVPGSASADVTDALLTILLADATTQIGQQATAYNQHYNQAITALTAHLAYSWLQMVSSVNGTGGSVQSQGFVERSETRGTGYSTSVPIALLPYASTAPGVFFLSLAVNRGRALSRGVT